MHFNHRIPTLQLSNVNQQVFPHVFLALFSREILAHTKKNLKVKQDEKIDNRKLYLVLLSRGGEYDDLLMRPTISAL